MGRNSPARRWPSVQGGQGLSKPGPESVEGLKICGGRLRRNASLKFCFWLAIIRGGAKCPPVPLFQPVIGEKEECCKRNNNSWQPCLRPFVRWKLFLTSVNSIPKSMYSTQWIQIRIRYYCLAFKTKVGFDTVFCILFSFLLNKLDGWL